MYMSLRTDTTRRWLRTVVEECRRVLRLKTTVICWRKTYLFIPEAWTMYNGKITEL